MLAVCNFAYASFSLTNHSYCIVLKLFLPSWLLRDIVNWGFFSAVLGRLICFGVVIDNILPNIL